MVCLCCYVGGIESGRRIRKVKISRIECGKAAAGSVSTEGQERILPEKMPRRKTSKSESKAHLTPLEQGIAVAMAALDQAPDVRKELVEKVRSQIEKGEYEVSGEDVADMMMRRRAADRIR